MGDRSLPSLPMLLLMGLALAGLVAVGYAAATSVDPFGPYTATWEGTSELRELADDGERELVVARNTSRYAETDANGTVAVILSPDERYDPAARGRLARFVENGGTLLLAEASRPHGDDLLAELGVETRIDGDPLRDETRYDRSPNFPLVSPVGEHPYLADVETIVLNHGTALTAPDERVLARSSRYAYLDHNRNGELDEVEELEDRPIVTVESIGDGEAIVVSDPSIFINVMLDRGDNRQFLTNVLDAHERVILDVSHTGELPPLALALLVLRESVILQLGVGLAALAGVRAGMRGRTRNVWSWLDGTRAVDGSRSPPEDAAIRRYVEEAHPDWDPDRVERVVSAVRSARDDT